MKVPFCDLTGIYRRQKEEIDSAVLQVMASGSYILGKEGEDFEGRMKRHLVGVESGSVVGCNSGTDALVLALLASGVKPGDQVITVSHTAIPTVTAIREVGAEPVFVDIDSRTWLMDLQLLNGAIGAKTKALIAVHLYGNMVSIPEIQKILEALQREDIAIIEDVAQAQGASLGSRQAGTLGNFGAFSFYPTKNLGAMGDGGAVFSRSEREGNLLRSLRNYGQEDRATVRVARGINSRLDEMQAAILKTRLESLQQRNETKSSMMGHYRKSLADFPVVFQVVSPNCRPAWHLCVVAFESEARRNALRSYLEGQGIETLIHYPLPVHLQSIFASGRIPTLNVTESLAKRIFSLPFHADLNSEQQNYIIENIRHGLSAR